MGDLCLSDGPLPVWVYRHVHCASFCGQRSTRATSRGAAPAGSGGNSRAIPKLLAPDYIYIRPLGGARVDSAVGTNTGCSVKSAWLFFPTGADQSAFSLLKEFSSLFCKTEHRSKGIPRPKYH